MEATPRMDAHIYRKTKKKRIGRNMPEREAQMALVQWARLNPLLRDHLIHIANEGRRSPQEGVALKAMGMRAGVSDLFLALPRGVYAGFWLELKAPGKKPTPEQIKWLTLMQHAGYRADWYDDWLKAVADINKYLAL